ncbi:Protein phosphatase 3 regulatory subunit B beta [Fasciolopsis buskii]|uniref:Protein phosphatase 3 regulatory subunit B beta n=1 Tax=Fasciolopsis buskii TaxID=27845 RepID=A0A8E0RN41_9TREM|nr:Protein phosphatase 3 regulatory subunit B beta [Fasciolopsis buski]
MDKPQIIGHIQRSVDFTLFDCAWIPVSTKFVVVGSKPRGTGTIQVYDVTAKEVKLQCESEKCSSFKCCTFGASRLPQRHLATGAFNGRMAIWDLGSGGHLEVPVYGVQAHSEIVNAIDAVGGLGIGEGAPEIATGSRDGSVKVWDPRQSKIPVATMEPESTENAVPLSSGGNNRRDCWTVAFGHAYNCQDRCLAAGYDNGDVKLFDLRAMKVRWETNVKNGVCSLQFDRKDIEMNKLVATTLEGKIHLWDMRTQHPKKGFACLTEKNQGATIWQVRHLPQQRDVFMTAGGNGSLCLWQYHYPSKRRRTVREAGPEGHGDIETAQGVVGTLSQLQNVVLSTQPVNSLDWCADKLGLAVCVSFDQTLRLLIVTKLNKL